jgi:hypothetical protein
VQSDPQAERHAIGRLAGLSHPGLVPLAVVRYDPGRLTLLSELTGGTLGDLFRECRAEGLPGVPREELVACLAAVAELLDHFQQTQGLQHLGLTPWHVVLDDGRPRLTDFGLAQLLWLPARQDLGPLNARYAAPELLARGLSDRCDQYALALIYQEMLTGTQPRSDPTAALYLSPLPEEDRPAVARALAINPGGRWPTCADFVRALEEVPRGDLPFVAAGRPADEPENAEAVERLILDLAAGAGRDLFGHGHRGLAFAGAGVQQQFSSRLSGDTVRAGLRLLCREWHGRVTRDDPGSFAFQVAQPASFWRRLTGLTSGLTVRATLTPAADGTSVRARAEPFGFDRSRGRDLLRTTGPYLLEEIGLAVQAASERRGGERITLRRPVRVRFVLPSRDSGRAVDCRGKDLSVTGIGLHLPGTLLSHRVEVELPSADRVVTLTAQVVRVRRAGGGYDVGAAFSR